MVNNFASLLKSRKKTGNGWSELKGLDNINKVKNK